MKTILFLLCWLASIPTTFDVNRDIDIIKVYERVLKMGYKNDEIYNTLIKNYIKNKDTLKVNKYKKLKNLLKNG